MWFVAVSSENDHNCILILPRPYAKKAMSSGRDEMKPTKDIKVFVTSLFSQATPDTEDAVIAYPMVTNCATCRIVD